MILRLAPPPSKTSFDTKSNITNASSDANKKSDQAINQHQSVTHLW
jgi:hypothetical protein